MELLEMLGKAQAYNTLQTQSKLLTTLSLGEVLQRIAQAGLPNVDSWSVRSFPKNVLFGELAKYYPESPQKIEAILDNAVLEDRNSIPVSIGVEKVIDLIELYYKGLKDLGFADDFDAEGALRLLELSANSNQ